MVNKPRKSAASSGAGVESKLPVSNDLQEFVANLKLASFASVVATCTEADVQATALDKLTNSSVAFAIQCVAVTLVCTAGKHHGSTACCPRLFDEHITSDRDDSIVGSKQPPEGIETMSN
jgi:hypothetical protein